MTRVHEADFPDCIGERLGLCPGEATGGDFPAVFKVLRDRHCKGWAIFDLDGRRKGDDGFDAIGGNLDLAVG